MVVREEEKCGGEWNSAGTRGNLHASSILIYFGSKYVVMSRIIPGMKEMVVSC